MFISRISSSVAVAFASSIALAVLAQTPAPAAKPEPAPASTFANYKFFSDKNPSVDWRDANDTVEKLDGHMGHVRGTPRVIKPGSAAATPLQPKLAPSANHNRPEVKKP
jgi:hypothetical protein